MDNKILSKFFHCHKVQTMPASVQNRWEQKPHTESQGCANIFELPITFMPAIY